jgi:hypothetical protein
MAVTDSRAWEPATLHQRFPDAEPWMIEDDVYDLDDFEQPENDDISSVENIRILCPGCGKYALTFESTALWD